MNSAISVSHLSVEYRAKRGEAIKAVRDLSFCVNEGEVVGFLGPNGAGKSSTLKAMMGFVSPTAGSIEIFGSKAGTPEAHQMTGYLPEVAMYYPFLTPIETLTMYGELQGLRGKELRVEAESLLELLGIASAAKKLNRSLSKGMLQRVGIAQALLGNPKLLVLDEVTSGLDPVGRKQLRDLLKDRQKQGTTLFFSSHELAEVDMLCDRIIMVNRGQLVEERPVPALRDELRIFSLHYLGAVSMVGLTEQIVEIAPNSYVAKFNSKPEMIKAIDRIHAAGSRIIDIASAEGSLEEYFIQTIEVAA